VKSRRSILGAIVLLGTTGLIAIAIELAASVWLHAIASEQQFLEYASLDQLRSRFPDGRFGKYVPHRYLGYVPAPSYAKERNRHNALGYRGEEISLAKPEGQFRIVLLGGSTTYTSFVKDYEKSFPHRLERQLRKRGYAGIRVINAGVPGYTSYESLINFEFRALDLDPDMVIVYHGVNDAIARMVWPPAAYRGDNSGFLRPATDVDSTPFHDRSNAIRILRIWRGQALSPAALERTFSKRSPSSVHQAFVAQKRNGNYPKGLFRKTPASQILSTIDARYFERNLEHIGVIAQHRGITPVFTSFAWCDQKNDPLVSPEYIAAMAHENVVSRQVAAELGAPWFDFAALFPNDPALFFGAVHLNDKGAHLKARLFADYLVDSGLIEAAR
jgi:lysophospholipase L1-like esterase